MATQVSTTVRLTKLPAVLVTAAAAVASSTGADAGNSPSKRSLVKQLTVNGQEVDVLIRFQEAHGALFVDLVAGETIAALSARVLAMDLTAVAAGHPSPTKDAIDTAALVAAGGT